MQCAAVIAVFCCVSCVCRSVGVKNATATTLPLLCPFLFHGSQGQNFCSPNRDLGIGYLNAEAPKARVCTCSGSPRQLFKTSRYYIYILYILLYYTNQTWHTLFAERPVTVYQSKPAQTSSMREQVLILNALQSTFLGGWRSCVFM
jgi:hypothetical protein